MFSIPPATTTSASPARMICEASATALRPDPQTMFAVVGDRNRPRRYPRLAAGALALSVPAVAGAAFGLPGLAGAPSTGPAPAPVGSITGSNTGVLGPDGPLGANGPLRGAGCVAPGVNPNSLGPDGPLGP